MTLLKPTLKHHRFLVILFFTTSPPHFAIIKPASLLYSPLSSITNVERISLMIPIQWQYSCKCIMLELLCSHPKCDKSRREPCSRQTTRDGHGSMSLHKACFMTKTIVDGKPTTSEGNIPPCTQVLTQVFCAFMLPLHSHPLFRIITSNSGGFIHEFCEIIELNFLTGLLRMQNPSSG